VPLGAPPAAVAVATDDTPPAVATLGATAPLTATVPVGGQSGAMVGLPTSSAEENATAGLPTVDLSAVAVVTATVDLTPSAATAASGSADTPTAEATATLFPTTTPTLTPSPTLTPTPIAGPTVRIGDETSTLPVRRLPGLDEPVLAVLVRGDIVLPLSSHAFHTGEVWREISTVAGIIGWVPERFLVFEDQGE
jgi:hypothetical protein